MFEYIKSKGKSSMKWMYLIQHGQCVCLHSLTCSLKCQCIYRLCLDEKFKFIIWTKIYINKNTY